MRKTHIEQIAKASGGTLVKAGSREFITGIKHDSREVGPGEMFVAVKGENQDGHKYIPQVLEKGCAALLVSDADAVPQDADVNAILVSDTIEARMMTISVKSTYCLPKKLTMESTGSSGELT